MVVWVALRRRVLAVTPGCHSNAMVVTDGEPIRAMAQLVVAERVLEQMVAIATEIVSVAVEEVALPRISPA